MDFPAWAQAISDAIWSSPIPLLEDEAEWDPEGLWLSSFPMQPLCPPRYQKLKPH